MPPPNEPGAREVCGICAIIGRITSGSFGDTIAELPRSWLILGDAQYYRGYCVLFAKRHVTEMHLMPRGEAHELIDELMAVGKTLERVVKPLKLNYECLGNQEPHVHWHVFPRYADDSMRLAPVWLRPESERKVSLEDMDRQNLIDAIRTDLVRIMPAARFK
jgi:diadenosine tetraphosphate (Ap4A) HIT family hydrolase